MLDVLRQQHSKHSSKCIHCCVERNYLHEAVDNPVLRNSQRFRKLPLDYASLSRYLCLVNLQQEIPPRRDPSQTLKIASPFAPFFFAATCTLVQAGADWRKC